MLGEKYNYLLFYKINFFAYPKISENILYRGRKYKTFKEYYKAYKEKVKARSNAKTRFMK